MIEISLVFFSSFIAKVQVSTFIRHWFEWAILLSRQEDQRPKKFFFRCYYCLDFWPKSDYEFNLSVSGPISSELPSSLDSMLKSKRIQIEKTSEKKTFLFFFFDPFDWKERIGNSILRSFETFNDWLNICLLTNDDLGETNDESFFFLHWI